MLEKLKTLSSRPLASAALASLLLVTAVAAQQLAGGPPEIAWFTIDGGNGIQSAWTGLMVQGTIGQHDAASEPLTGGSFTVVGGFWAGLSTVPAPVCFGDIAPGHGDGIVNVSDLLALIGMWGQGSGSRADLNGDGTVNVADLLRLIAEWGTC